MKCLDVDERCPKQWCLNADGRRRGEKEEEGGGRVRRGGMSSRPGASSPMPNISNI